MDSYWINYQKGGKQAQMTQAQIDAVVSQIQQDIMANGPLTATMEVYADFQDWDATQGVYTGPKAGSADLGGHAVVIIGWDRTPAGVPYWLIRNSWSRLTLSLNSSGIALCKSPCILACLQATKLERKASSGLLWARIRSASNYHLGSHRQDAQPLPDIVLL